MINYRIDNAKLRFEQPTVFCQILKIQDFLKISIFDFSIFLKEDAKFIWQGNSTSLSGGNLVDGLPPASSMETIAKPARLGPAENGKLIEKIELSRFCSMKYVKTQRKPCQAYVDDQHECNKI